jgi:predicted dehydrogenase
VSEIGSHFVDAVDWIVAPVQEVCAIVHAIPRAVLDEQGREVPHETLDFATALLRTAGGAQGQFTVSKVTPARDPLPFIQVVGEEGALWASLTRGQEEFLRRIRPGGGWEELDLPAAARDGTPHAIFRMLASFVGACQRGSLDASQDADFEEGYRVQSALDQLVASAASRRFEPVAQGLARAAHADRQAARPGRGGGQR